MFKCVKVGVTCVTLQLGEKESCQGTLNDFGTLVKGHFGNLVSALKKFTH